MLTERKKQPTHHVRTMQFHLSDKAKNLISGQNKLSGFWRRFHEGKGRDFRVFSPCWKKWSIGQDSVDDVSAQHVFISAESSAELLHCGKLPIIYHHLLPACRGLTTQLTASPSVLGSQSGTLNTSEQQSDTLSVYLLLLSHIDLINTLPGISLVQSLLSQNPFGWGQISILWNLKQSTYLITSDHMFGIGTFAYDGM